MHSRNRLLATFAAALLPLGSLASIAQAPPSTTAGIPHLEQRGHATQLVVDGQPFLILGGELHNSSSSSLAYMAPVWPRLAAGHLNTVVTPVAWETIEPREGDFDFRVVDGLLTGARQNHLKLVILWFGAWKNTFSSYVPAWVKQDTRRFPRAQSSDGRNAERLSAFAPATQQADMRAFGALMQHLREQDSAGHTVLLVQVENEVGSIPESRDHSLIAEKAFTAPVPAPLLRYMQAHRATLNPDFRAAWEAAGAKIAGSWTDVFGNSPLTDDLFMAWHYATYTEGVARAGKQAYPLLMYANAALIRPNYQPGQYNSGGPLPHSMDVWRAGAPSLDFLSPDIYFNEFALWAGLYTRPGNPLFIPEAQGGASGAANALYAFGRLDALGFSPFGIDDEGNTPLDLVGITNPAERPNNHPIAALFAELTHLTPQLLAAQAAGNAYAALLEGDAQRGARLEVGLYTADITRTSAPHDPNAHLGVLFLATAPDEYLVTGTGDLQVNFSLHAPGGRVVAISSIDEEFFEDGAWVPHRRLNGDETNQGQALRIEASDLAQGRIYRVRLYRLPARP